MNEDQRNKVVNIRYIFIKLSTEKYFSEKAPVHVLKEERKQKKIQRQRSEEERKKLKDLEQKKEEAEKALEAELQKERAESEQEIAEQQNEEIEETKSPFHYSDEELMKMQQSGQLKIQTPKMDQMKQEREAALQKLQDERVEQIRREINKINHAKKLQELLDELNGLIGLSEVKKRDTISYQFDKSKKDAGKLSNALYGCELSHGVYGKSGNRKDNGGKNCGADLQRTGNFVQGSFSGSGSLQSCGRVCGTDGY